MSKKGKKRDHDELEREAIRDIVRLMRAWAARLGPDSPVGRSLEQEAEASLRILTPSRSGAK